MAARVETKVSWASLAASVLTGLVFAANHTSLIPGYDDWPTWPKAIVSIIVIAGGTFGAGYAAPHTPRPAEPLAPAAGVAAQQKENLERLTPEFGPKGGYPGGNVTGPPTTWANRADPPTD